jgi:UDP-glucuronate 4-epimerase
MRCLVTGTAGFIGFHVARRLLEAGHHVTGVDGMVPYYDVKLKEDRHALLAGYEAFSPHICMLEEDRFANIAEAAAPDLVVHLAAQAGVLHSLEHPLSYINSNIVGTFNVLEASRRVRPQHLVIASTSSVYGACTEYPSGETSRSDHPLTLYAASKKSAEALAHCYSHVWELPITIFRFFSAYGPWGRPDMALFKFVRNILAGCPIDVYNHGLMERDWTYIDDLVEAIVRLSGCVPRVGDNTGSLSPVAPCRVVNIGGGHPVSLLQFIEEIEEALGRKAERNFMEMQLGEVTRSEASTALLESLTGYRPSTPTSVGIGEFVRWYRQYYDV